MSKRKWMFIARLIANEQVLNDKEWAIELCLDSIKSTDDSNYLLDVACFVVDLNKEKSINIFKAALEKAEDSMEFLNVACNISSQEKLNDKKWGKQIFEKALAISTETTEKILINKSMEQYL